MPRSPWPRAALLGAVALGASAAALAGGCGSSGSSSGSAPSSTPAAAANSGTTSTNGSTLKVSTAPKYGTPSPSSPVLGGTVQIAYRDITIQPDIARVKAGTTVRWTNYDTVEHNVTAESGPQRFASGEFAEGHTFQVTFTKAGIYHYECTIHPTSMNGTIEVVS